METVQLEVAAPEATSDAEIPRLRPARSGLTILIPAYNESASIVDTIKSIQSQTLPPDEIIVIDDHSSDSTGDLARASDWQVSPIVLRHGCSIGAGAVVVAGVDVGRYATVGAGAVVTRTVPDNALVAGNPARRLGWVCDCGQRLTDSATGAPVPATPDADTDLLCPACDRHFAYVPDAEAIRDTPAPAAVPGSRRSQA